MRQAIEELSYDSMALELSELPSSQPTPEQAMEQREQQLMEEFGLTYMEAWNLVQQHRARHGVKH